jgi:uncharacterized RDD family membrane protein YckC
MIFKKFRKTVFNPTNLIYQQSLTGLPLASFTRRALAFMIDSGIIVFIICMYALPETLRSQSASGDFTMNIDPFHGWEIVTFPLYFGLWTYFGHGQTLGKKIFRIRVVSLVHERLTLGHSIERSLGYGMSILEGGFGFIQYFFHPHGQTVHDRIAETIVIRVNVAGKKEKSKK